MKEEPKLTMEWHCDPLLEYVRAFANEYFPNYDGEDLGPSDYPCKFVQRMKANAITPPYTFGSYMQYTDIQDTMDAFGLDASRFWFLLLFFHDLTNGAFQWKESRTNLSPRTELKNLYKKIQNNIKWGERGPEFTHKMELALTVEGERVSTKVKLPMALHCLADALESYLKAHGEEEYALLLDTRTVGRVPNNNVSETRKVIYFTQLMREFMEDRKGTIKEGSSHTLSLNKTLFISRLLVFTRLTTDKEDKRWSDHWLKTLWNQPSYKELSIKQRNKFYTL